jgi:hypothetical protein
MFKYKILIKLCVLNCVFISCVYIWWHHPSGSGGVVSAGLAVLQYSETSNNKHLNISGKSLNQRAKIWNYKLSTIIMRSFSSSFSHQLFWIQTNTTVTCTKSYVVITITIQNTDFDVIVGSLVEFTNILEEFTVSSFRTGVLTCRFTQQVSMKKTNVSCYLLKPNSL